MLGLTRYYHKFIPVYADLVWPLTQLNHKTIPFIWTEQCQKAYKTLKEFLMKSLILVYPDQNKPYTWFMDTLKYAWSAVLTQVHISVMYGKTLKYQHPFTYRSGFF